MKALGAIPFVELLVGILFLGVGRTRGSERRDPQPLVSGPMFEVTPPKSMQPVPVQSLQRTCGCKNIGCTL
jgi:hypothetical protein